MTSLATLALSVDKLWQLSLSLLAPTKMVATPTLASQWMAAVDIPCLSFFQHPLQHLATLYRCQHTSTSKYTLFLFLFLFSQWSPAVSSNDDGNDDPLALAVKCVTTSRYAFFIYLCFLFLMWSDDKRPSVNDDGPPVATSTPTSRIDNNVPHFQPPDDHDDSGHPRPIPSFLWQWMSFPSYNMLMPVCQQFFLSFNLSFTFPLPQHCPTTQPSPAQWPQCRPKWRRGKWHPQTRGCSLTSVSTCCCIVVPPFFHYHLFTVITCSLLFIN